MSVRTQLLLAQAVSVLVGSGLVAMGLAQRDLEYVLVVLGGLAIAIACAGIVATTRWLRPSTRLPESLRDIVPAASWRHSVVSLELRDGTRITCVVIRPGGYVVPRKTDPPFDTRDAVAVVPATEADYATEKARQSASRD